MGRVRWRGKDTVGWMVTMAAAACNLYNLLQAGDRVVAVAWRGGESEPANPEQPARAEKVPGRSS